MLGLVFFLNSGELCEEVTEGKVHLIGPDSGFYHGRHQTLSNRGIVSQISNLTP